jgi:hypothetical protein
MNKYSLCPICGRQYDFDFTICGFCRLPDHAGGAGGRVRLWQVTQTERGAVYHPPGSLAPRPGGIS